MFESDLVNIIRCVYVYSRTGNAATAHCRIVIAATLISELDSQKDQDVIHRITKAEIMLSAFPSLPRGK